MFSETGALVGGDYCQQYYREDGRQDFACPLQIFLRATSGFCRSFWQPRRKGVKKRKTGADQQVVVYTIYNCLCARILMLSSYSSSVLLGFGSRATLNTEIAQSLYWSPVVPFSCRTIYVGLSSRCRLPAIASPNPNKNRPAKTSASMLPSTSRLLCQIPLSAISADRRPAVQICNWYKLLPQSSR